MQFTGDIAAAKSALAGIAPCWDGKTCITEMKDAGCRQWRQMEWFGFYFEFLCNQRLGNEFAVPGDRYGTAATACFDAKGAINWDFKAKAIKSDDHRSILNDKAAVDESVRKHGAHGVIIALCDVDYNDENRSFQKWHDELKGKKSKYTLAREKRTSISRYRKTGAVLREILFAVLTAKNMHLLDTYNQGRNSNGAPRPPKYMLNFDAATDLIADKIDFQ